MSEVNLGDAQQVKPKKAKQRQRTTPKPAQISEHETEAEARAAAAEPIGPGHGAIPQDVAGQQVTSAANPYVVTGWRPRTWHEFDVTLPSGQLCRIRRLERDDLIRMDLLQYLDTFTPMLLEDTMSDADRERLMTDEVKKNPAALQQMLRAIDKVVMSATIRPQITEDPNKVNYGNEADWANPNFVPVALLDDINTEERMYIFGACFGSDMDALKRLLEQTKGLASVDAESGV